MDEVLMLCASPICIQEGNHFFYYPSQRSLHKNHKTSLVHPAAFLQLFNDQELLGKREIEETSQNLHGEYSQMRHEILEALEQAIESHRLSSLKLLWIFQNQNEAEFAKMVESAAKNGGNQFYVQMALLAISEQKVHPKDKIRKAMQKRMDQFKGKVKDIISRIAQGGKEPQTRLAESQTRLVVYPQKLDRPFGRKQPNRMEEQSPSPFQNETQPTPETDQIDNIQLHHQSNLQIDASKQHVQTIQIPENSFDINSQEPCFTFKPETRTAAEALPKEKYIKKQRRRGRPCKQSPNNCTSKYDKLPFYGSIFLHTDMDLFFPKGLEEDYFYPITDLARSKKFKARDQRNIVISSLADYKFVASEIRLIEDTKQLTINQKKVKSDDQKLNLTIVFGLFRRRNQLIYFHLKDAYLDDKFRESMRLLLERNRQSMQTLMIEECQHLPQQITFLISEMPNLKFLKLHADFDRVFFLSLEYILKLEGLQALSLSSARFVDHCGMEIEEGNPIFKNLRWLRHLNHLGLYNCYPVYDEFLENLHPDLEFTLTHLNLGITNITRASIPALKRFKSLTQLSLDETQLNGKDIIQIFEDSEHNQLKELGVWRLNQIRWKQEKRGFLNGNITRHEMNRLTELLPNLEYINIANCKGLNGFPLNKFPSLKYAFVSEDMFDPKDLKLLKKKINIYVEQPHQAQNPRSSHNLEKKH